MTIDVSLALVSFVWTLMTALVVGATTWGVLKTQISNIARKMEEIEERHSASMKEAETRFQLMEREISAIHRSYVSNESLNRIYEDIRVLQTDIKKILALMSRRLEDAG